MMDEYESSSEPENDDSTPLGKPERSKDVSLAKKLSTITDAAIKAIEMGDFETASLFLDAADRMKKEAMAPVPPPAPPPAPPMPPPGMPPGAPPPGGPMAGPPPGPPGMAGLMR